LSLRYRRHTDQRNDFAWICFVEIFIDTTSLRMKLCYRCSELINFQQQENSGGDISTSDEHRFVID